MCTTLTVTKYKWIKIIVCSIRYGFLKHLNRTCCYWKLINIVHGNRNPASVLFLNSLLIIKNDLFFTDWSPLSFSFFQDFMASFWSEVRSVICCCELWLISAVNFDLGVALWLMTDQRRLCSFVCSLDAFFDTGRQIQCCVETHGAKRIWGVCVCVDRMWFSDEIFWKKFHSLLQKNKTKLIFWST